MAVMSSNLSIITLNLSGFNFRLKDSEWIKETRSNYIYNRFTLALRKYII